MASNPFSLLGARSAPLKTQVYADVVNAWPDRNSSKLPVVYSPHYNISFFGIEKLIEPLELPIEALKDVHTDSYITSIHTSSWTVAKVTELQPLVALPPWLLRWRVVSPMKYHVAGTIAAAGLAMQHGWAINLGGGMHHAYKATGMGWCPFDDITLAIRRLRLAQGADLKVLYIDLDAHQGNGVARDKQLFNDKHLFVLDAYNALVFPKDDEAKPAIDIAVELRSGAGTDEYLEKLEQALEQAASRFVPDLVFYNAGTDVLEGDPLGRLAVSEEGVVRRDEMVWRFAAERVGAPIVMTLSGGYAPRSAAVVTKSLANLITTFHLTDKSGLAADRDASAVSTGGPAHV